MKAAIFFAVCTTLSLSAMDDGNTESSASDENICSFHKAMLITSKKNTEDTLHLVSTALSMSNNRYIDFMKDAPAVKDWSQRSVCRTLAVQEPGTYSKPVILAFFREDGTCIVKADTLPIVAKDRFYNDITVGQKVGSSTVVLFNAGSVWAGEGVAPENIIRLCNSFMKRSLSKKIKSRFNKGPSFRNFFLQNLIEGIMFEKDQAEYLLYMGVKVDALKEIHRSYEQDYYLDAPIKNVDALFFKVLKRMAQGKEPKATPKVKLRNQDDSHSDDAVEIGLRSPGKAVRFQDTLY